MLYAAVFHFNPFYKKWQVGKLNSGKLHVNLLLIITGLLGKPSHKMGFRSSVSQSGHPGEVKHEGLVRRNDVLTNGFI